MDFGVGQLQERSGMPLDLPVGQIRRRGTKFLPVNGTGSDSLS
jgi:hypothetical protein